MVTRKIVEDFLVQNGLIYKYVIVIQLNVQHPRIKSKTLTRWRDNYFAIAIVRSICSKSIETFCNEWSRNFTESWSRFVHRAKNLTSRTRPRNPDVSSHTTDNGTLLGQSRLYVLIISMSWLVYSFVRSLLRIATKIVGGVGSDRSTVIHLVDEKTWFSTFDR